MCCKAESEKEQEAQIKYRSTATKARKSCTKSSVQYFGNVNTTHNNACIYVYYLTRENKQTFLRGRGEGGGGAYCLIHHFRGGAYSKERKGRCSVHARTVTETKRLRHDNDLRRRWRGGKRPLSLSLSLQAFGEPTNHWRVCSTYTHPSRNLGRMSTKTSKSTTVKSQYKFTWKAFSHDSRVVENLLSPLTPPYGMVDEEFRCVHRSGASLFRPLPPKIQCR